MYAKLVSGPAIEPVSLAEAKLQCRVDTSDEDARISALIVTARRQAEQATGRAWITQTWDFLADSFPAGCREIELLRNPVQSVISITYTDADGNSQPLDASAYVFEPSAVPAVLVPAYGSTWPATRCMPGAVRIRCSCGYGAAATDVPAEVKQWMLLQIAHWHENVSAAAGKDLAPLPYVDGLLDPYRVIRFG